MCVTFEACLVVLAVFSLSLPHAERAGSGGFCRRALCSGVGYHVAGKLRCITLSTYQGCYSNVLKPVPQPPLEPELVLNKASGTKLFWGRPCHVDAQHGPKQEAGVQGGGTAPLVGSGAKPQKPAMICTYYNQLYNGKCYSCTQLSTLHFVINLLEPACDMLARGWPSAGTRN